MHNGKRTMSQRKKHMLQFFQVHSLFHGQNDEERRQLRQVEVEMMYFAIFFENLEKQQINTIATALASSRDILHQQRSNSQVFASLILGKRAILRDEGDDEMDVP